MTTSTPSYDIAIIGAGPGGYTLAKRLAKAGKKVALIDKQPVGGTCLQAGCIPSKAMIQASHGWASLKQQGSTWGIQGVAHTQLDWQALQAHQTQTVTTLTQGLQQSLKHAGVTLCHGAARFVDTHQLMWTSPDNTSHRLAFEQAVIATGGKPLAPPWLPTPDGQRILTSDHLWTLPQAPEHLLVLGGGVIGLEMACMFAGLGIQTTVIELQETLCSTMLDPDLSQQLLQGLKHLPSLSMHLGCKAQQLDLTPEGVTLSVTSMKGALQTLSGSHLLLALGRTPYTEGLGLETLGIVPEAQGAFKGTIPTNAYSQTQHSHIYALGDCTQGLPLAHRASMQAHAIAQTMLMPHCPRTLADHAALPSVVFSNPEVASVGLTQKQAQEAGYRNVKHWDAPFKLSGKAWGHSKHTAMAGVCRWVTHGEHHQIIGAQVIGEQASELIAQAALALEFQATLEDIALTIHAHPTLSELWWEAALLAC